MFIPFFLELKAAKVPVSLREYLSLLEGLEADLVTYDVEGFYYLARTALVKDERHIDRFDQVFSHVFKGVEAVSGEGGIDPMALPEEWLRKLAEKHLTDEEKKLVEALGGFDKLMETLKQRLEEQKDRHQGGSKWIGTAGTSPFGAYGYNPEGVRIGQHESRHRRAVKVWDKREFRNFDDSVELGTRNIKVALKRLRRWARQGAHDEFDLDGTIRSTAEHGYLDVQMRPERRNAVKLLMFFDVGGSMDDHIRSVEELFSAARAEFKHLEYYYFHNCLYESVWKDNRRRHGERIPTFDVLHTYGPDYRVVFVGDAAMSPYEIAYPGGSVEHWNEETGAVWMQRVLEKFPKSVWLNPESQDRWRYTQSTAMLTEIMGGKMYPLTLKGLDEATRELSR
ncbi:vWA domain-containing protein [Oricola nitratireducens]|uniref:vWA domain-containing protein n=1 Tax=Oricola nitratireducens TaxID=2775868 RepID=UPI001866CD4F|nr:VWA domain-containing protein [Oricola nitratireducens]